MNKQDIARFAFIKSLEERGLLGADEEVFPATVILKEKGDHYVCSVAAIRERFPERSPGYYFSAHGEVSDLRVTQEEWSAKVFVRVVSPPFRPYMKVHEVSGKIRR